MDEEAVQIEISRMPAADFADLNQQIIESSLQQYVLGKGYQISHMLTTYRAVNVSREQAALLGCKKGSPAMHISNRGILDGGRVYEIRGCGLRHPAGDFASIHAGGTPPGNADLPLY